MKIPEKDWAWFGIAGHFVEAHRCRFHLTTLVGKVVVSTVGELVRRENQDEFSTIGADRKYETMVFRWNGDRCTKAQCKCNMPIIENFNEIAVEGYQTRREAHEGHLRMCRKWASSSLQKESAVSSNDSEA